MNVVFTRCDVRIKIKILTVLSVLVLYIIDFDKVSLIQQEVLQAWTLSKNEQGIQQPRKRISFITSEKCEREISSVREKWQGTNQRRKPFSHLRDR